MNLKIGVSRAKFLEDDGKKCAKQQTTPQYGAGPGLSVVGGGDPRKARGVFGFDVGSTVIMCLHFSRICY